jgi:hypothetical protein
MRTDEGRQDMLRMLSQRAPAPADMLRALDSRATCTASAGDAVQRLTSWRQLQLTFAAAAAAAVGYERDRRRRLQPVQPETAARLVNSDEIYFG